MLQLESPDPFFYCRTAAVKHHLRKMADRHEMLSTYEHDFGTPVTLLQECERQ